MSKKQHQPTAQSTKDAQREMEDLQLQNRMSHIGHKLLVLSGKGGVGKSTVAANLAISLAMEGLSVGLLDVDVHGPSIPTLMGLTGQHPTTADNELLPVELAENLKVMSVGFMLKNAADPVIWRGPMKFNVIRQFLKDVSWGSLDYLVIDSPPGTGDEPLAVAQLVGQPASAVIVTTPQDLAIADVRRSVGFCKSLSLPVAGIIENMSGMVCPHCNQSIELFGSGGGAALAEEMDVPMLGCVPIDPGVVSAGDQGTPFVRRLAGSPSATAMAEIVKNVLTNIGPAGAQDTPTETADGKLRMALPLAGGKLCSHFGHCEQFAIVTVSPEDKQVISRQLLTPPTHEPGVLPRWLAEQGVGLIIAGGMGQRAQQLLSENGIDVLAGVTVEEPDALVTAYLNDALAAGENICDH